VRVLIVGAGSVGQYLAARLRMGGHDVILLARSYNVRVLADQGITLTIGEQHWPVSVRATADPSDPLLNEPFELAIVAVKTYDTVDAAGSIRAGRGCADASVLTIQNGLGNEEILSDAFGERRIVAGAFTTAAKLAGPSNVEANDKGGLTVAPVGSQPHNWLLAALEPTGMKLRAASDWRAIKWSKLALNLLGNAVCAILDWGPLQTYQNATAFAIERRCLLETANAMNRLGIAPVNLIDFPSKLLFGMVRTLPPALLRPLLTKRVAGARGNKPPSLLRDVRAGKRQLEVGALNGTVAERARAAGVSAPANAAVARILTGIARGEIDWNLYRAAPQALMDAIDKTTV